MGKQIRQWATGFTSRQPGLPAGNQIRQGKPSSSEGNQVANGQLSLANACKQPVPPVVRKTFLLDNQVLHPVTKSADGKCMSSPSRFRWWQPSLQKTTAHPDFLTYRLVPLLPKESICWWCDSAKKEMNHFRGDVKITQLQSPTYC